MVLVGSLPRAISKIRKIRVKETRIELPPTWRFYPARLVRLERFVVTTQVVLDCEATCGTAICGIYFNTNLTNLSNCAGLTSNKETIRFVFHTNLSEAHECR